MNPDFCDLEDFLRSTPYTGRHTEFMYMGSTADAYSMYKHTTTRRYVTTDGVRCVQYTGGRYTTADKATQLAHAFSV